MNFGFDESQEQLRAEIRKLLEARSPLEEVRRVCATPAGHCTELWKQLGELGWLGLVLPESLGGGGLGWVDLTVVLEECGRALLPSPLISTLLAGTTIADGGSAAQRERWLPGLVDGSRVGALALFDDPAWPDLDAIRLVAERDGEGFVLSGEKPLVADVGCATLFVVGFRDGDDVQLAVVERDAPGVSTEDTPSIDATRRLGTLRLDAVAIAPIAVLDERPGALLARRAFDRGVAATTAEIIGSCEGLLDITVQYAKDRVQFGSPIGRYQGVKHPLAEAYVDIECMKSLCYYAAWALDESPDEVPFSVSKAKGYASEAVTRIGVTGIQLHGAVGYTEEYDCQLYLKRSKWARPAYGDEDFHYERVATLGGV